jgi:hypothetical protein
MRCRPGCSRLGDKVGRIVGSVELEVIVRVAIAQWEDAEQCPLHWRVPVNHGCDDVHRSREDVV